MNTIIKGIGRSLVLSTERTNHLLPLPRFLGTTNIGFASKTEEIARKLGIPRRPKKPMTGYLRFLSEIRPTLKTANNTPKEIMSAAAVQWNNLDEAQKKKYKAEFDKENEIFRKRTEAYEKSLTKEQKLAIQDELIKLKEIKAENAKRIEKKNRLKELGKPKRAQNAFVLFYIDENSKSKTTIQATKVKYTALSPAEKKPYEQKAAALQEQYRKDLQAWQTRMQSKGLVDLLPSKSQSKLLKLTK